MTVLTNNDASVHKYLDILQSIIGRMAANSTGCKTWCITLVSAAIVIVVDKNKPNYVWIALVPVFLFLFLDVYYLGLERSFRSLYNDFVVKLHNNSAQEGDLFLLKTKLSTSTAIDCLFSTSIWPFYSLLTLCLIAVRIWIV